MLDLLYQGGPLFMGILTLLFLALLVVSFIKGKAALQNSVSDSNDVLRNGLKPIKSIGTLALVIGVLGQLIGLYSGFQAMEASGGGFSPEIIAGGLKVSMITTIYGVIIFLISRLIHLFISSRIK